MKKKLSYIVIAAVAALLAFGFVFAANQNAIDNSQACSHASDTGKTNANENSVLNRCVPVNSCGNGNCEAELGENFATCPQDCTG